MKSIYNKQIKLLKQDLLKKQNIILNSINHEIKLENNKGDEIDHAQEEFIRAMTNSLTLREREALQRIKRSLYKIERGTFGICEECEEAISIKRLKILPDSRMCIGCAEKVEFGNRT